jgi:DNA-binding transcriptional MocR family regulator
VLPVAGDAQGPLPSSLQRALRHEPVALVYEPRSVAPDNALLTPSRRDELAALLQQHGTLVIEDDGLADLSARPYHGIGSALPEQTVMVRSYSKSHGPDLRLALVAGAWSPVERVRVYRQYGSGWTSRILQNALAWALTAAEPRAAVTRAREIYARRRAEMGSLLADRGVAVSTDDGLGVWVPVEREHEASLVLASHGIAVTTAADSWTRPGPPAIRVATGRPLPDPAFVADTVALAVRAR